MKFVFEWIYGRRRQSVIKPLSCKCELIILFKLLTTKNLILLKNDKIYQFGFIGANRNETQYFSIICKNCYVLLCFYYF